MTEEVEIFAQKVAQAEDSGVDSLEYWKKKCQELENEMVLIKGITVTNSPELREANKKIKELEEGLANALEVNESHQKLNGKLQEGLTELEEENKKLHNTLNKKMDDVRKAGL